MPSLYDVTNHPLLSGGARFLTPDELDAESMLAEMLLGLSGLSVFSGTSLDKAKMAVALQVSFQVERGIDGAVVASKTEGVRSMTYRNDLVHSMALKVAQEIIGTSDTSADDYAPLRSLRGTGQGPALLFPSSGVVDPDTLHYR